MGQPKVGTIYSEKKRKNLGKIELNFNCDGDSQNKAFPIQTPMDFDLSISFLPMNCGWLKLK